jgi:enediyne biosynthesis protein E4
MKLLNIFWFGIALLLLSACGSREHFFAQLSAKATGIDFVNVVTETDSLNVMTYPYLVNGAGVAIADFNNDGWEDIFFVGNQKGSNKLYINNQHFKFSDITNTAGVAGKSDWCTGVTITDINADGWIDIYVSTVSIAGKLNSANELYINNKNGSFTESAIEYGLNLSCHSTQSAFFDYDNDGDLDCFVLNHAPSYAEDYAGVEKRKTIDSLSGSKLLENRDNKFVDVTNSAGIYSSNMAYGLGIAVGDLNNDGWQDLYVSNDFKENDYCYINSGNKTFLENAEKLFGHMSRFSMGNDMADYNNDGWLDMMTLDMLSEDEKVLKASVADDDISVYNYKHSNFGFHYQFSKNCLQQNVQGKYFKDVALQMGVAATDWSWAPLMADFDNDGFKDLFISNGFKYRFNDLDYNHFVQNEFVQMQIQGKPLNRFDLVKQIPDGKVADYFYLNQNGTGFENASERAGFIKPTLSNGAAYADFDKDGDLDLVVSHLDETAGIYENAMPPAHWISISLKGDSKNTIGIGAKLFVYIDSTVQCVQQSPARGFMSAVSPNLHFGLGQAAMADSIKISWPDGRQQLIKQVKPNQQLIIYQKDAVQNDGQFLDSSDWVDITIASGINFTHKEDDFEDLDVHPFLPHSYATQGPKIAVADVNADGLEDFFICGAKKQAGKLFLQNDNAKFIDHKQAALEQDSACEDTDAVFFDADNDRDLDLYVTSGGGEYFASHPFLKDRLYLNDGKANFTKSTTLPDLYENKSTVRHCDFDKDGDMDLFVGGRVNARSYGYLPASVVLQNDGTGKFTEKTELIAKGLGYVGRVTDACWTDVDKDSWMDLLIVGEWMQPTIFKNEKGMLRKMQDPELGLATGWWNTLFASDIDNDGDEDFLIGNWGSNSKLQASKKHPLTMLVADWDNNGEEEPVLTLYKNQDYYTFLGKNDLEKRLPYLKKSFLKYREIAGKTVHEIFSPAATDKAKKMQAGMLASAILLNDNGHFSIQALPPFLQTAPIFSFAQLQKTGDEKGWIAVGNFYETTPFEGRYDALLPQCFSINNNAVFEESTIFLQGAIRCIRKIVLANKTVAYLLAINNGSLRLIKNTSLNL